MPCMLHCMSREAGTSACGCIEVRQTHRQTQLPAKDAERQGCSFPTDTSETSNLGSRTLVQLCLFSLRHLGPTCDVLGET